MSGLDDGDSGRHHQATHSNIPAPFFAYSTVKDFSRKTGLINMEKTLTNPSSGSDFIIGCMFVGGALLLGLFTLFARAENIERPFVVGGFTVSGSLFALILLDHLHRIHPNFGFKSLFWVAAISMSGFGIGRIVDWAMGPKPDFQPDGESLDTNLAD